MGTIHIDKTDFETVILNDLNYLSSHSEISKMYEMDNEETIDFLNSSNIKISAVSENPYIEISICINVDDITKQTFNLTTDMRDQILEEMNTDFKAYIGGTNLNLFSFFGFNSNNTEYLVLIFQNYDFEPALYSRTISTIYNGKNIATHMYDYDYKVLLEYEQTHKDIVNSIVYKYPPEYPKERELATFPTGLGSILPGALLSGVIGIF